MTNTNENTFDLTVLTFDELVILEKSIKDLKVVKREEAKVAAREAKEARVAEFKGTIGENDTITFLYGRDNIVSEGTVVRASEKTITVKSTVFAENGKKDTNYVRYDRVVEILEKGEVEDNTDEEVAM